jgi:hypothetical protein
MNPVYDCNRIVEIEDEPRHHLVMANDYVRAFAVEVAPHERTLCHHHPNDYLIFVASGAEIISAARDEEPKRLSYAAGECELSRAGLIHVVENLRDRPFRNIVVELLPAVSGLRRGDNPQELTGDVAIKQAFDDTRGSIFEMKLQGGSDVAIFGPAIIASPDGHELGAVASGELEIKRDSICELAWLPAKERAKLRGSEKHGARIVVFQVGVND